MIGSSILLLFCRRPGNTGRFFFRAGPEAKWVAPCLRSTVVGHYSKDLAQCLSRRERAAGPRGLTSGVMPHQSRVARNVGPDASRCNLAGPGATANRHGLRPLAGSGRRWRGFPGCTWRGPEPKARENHPAPLLSIGSAIPTTLRQFVDKHHHFTVAQFLHPARAPGGVHVFWMGRLEHRRRFARFEAEDPSQGPPWEARHEFSSD